MRQQQMITNDNIHDALVRFILNCVMFHSSFSFGIFLSFILRLMVSLFKKNNMYNVQEYNILYNNDVPAL